MIARHRSTQPVMVYLDRAEGYLEKSRATIDRGRPVHALFWIMHGLFALLRAEAKLEQANGNAD